MRDDILTPVAEESKLEKLYNYFLRLLSLFCLLLAITYWLRILGVFSGDLWRFDLMPQQWQALTATMSVIYPVAACGLWMCSGWGAVLWFLAGLAESLAMTVYAADYTWFPLIAVIHSIFLVIFISFRVLFYINKRRKNSASVAY